MTLAAVLLTLALLVQVGLTLVVYGVLLSGRLRALNDGRVKPETYVTVSGEPEELAVVTRNLANQFELPVLFYALVLLLLAIGAAIPIDAMLAWVFVISRIGHAFAAIRSRDIRLRLRWFQFGFAAVVLLLLRCLSVLVAGIT